MRACRRRDGAHHIVRPRQDVAPVRAGGELRVGRRLCDHLFTHALDDFECACICIDERDVPLLVTALNDIQNKPFREHCAPCADQYDLSSHLQTSLDSFRDRTARTCAAVPLPAKTEINIFIIFVRLRQGNEKKYGFMKKIRLWRNLPRREARAAEHVGFAMRAGQIINLQKRGECTYILRAFVVLT